MLQQRDEVPEALARQLARDEILVREGALQPACRCRLWPATTPAPRGVVLLLHGFTAGPWQFDELAPKLAAAGLTAYAARLPGHGASLRHDDDAPNVAGARDDASGFPRSREHAQFGHAAVAAWSEARALATAIGVPLFLVGHSAGGAMAMDVLLRPDCGVARAVLVAPLLRPRRRADYTLVRALGRVPFTGWLTDRVRLSWPVAAARSDGWVRPGHRRFRLGHVVALFRYAGSVQRVARAAARLGQSLPPIQLICTAGDDKVDFAACESLARQRPKRHYLHCFAPATGVPHAMLTRYENPNDEARALVHALCRDFLVDGVGRDGPSIPGRPTS